MHYRRHDVFSNDSVTDVFRNQTEGDVENRTKLLFRFLLMEMCLLFVLLVISFLFLSLQSAIADLRWGMPVH